MKRRVAGVALAASLAAGGLQPGAADARAATAAAPAPDGSAPLVAPSAPLIPTPPPGWPEPPAVTAEAFLLIVAETGQVLAERRADEARPVASTVKMLTALTVLRRAELDEVVVVGDEVAGVGGASTSVEPGERWTVADLLDALLVRSGNDAAVALAAHVAGSVEAFLKLMRADAAALGLDDVVLSSPSGLEDRNRLTARDLATITRAVLAEPTLRSIVAQTDVTIDDLGVQPTRNDLLETYPGATGVKTGYTDAAGWSVVASAERDDRELVAVVLTARGYNDRFRDAAVLLDHGFEAFVVQPAGGALRLARAGADATIRTTTVAVSVPRAEPELVTALDVPVEVPAQAGAAAVRWRGTSLFTLDAELAAPPRPPVAGGEAVGRHLQDRAYAALRAAVAADIWRQ